MTMYLPFDGRSTHKMRPKSSEMDKRKRERTRKRERARINKSEANRITKEHHIHCTPQTHLQFITQCNRPFPVRFVLLSYSSRKWWLCRPKRLCVSIRFSRPFGHFVVVIAIDSILNMISSATTKKQRRFTVKRVYDSHKIYDKNTTHSSSHIIDDC